MSLMTRQQGVAASRAPSRGTRAARASSSVSQSQLGHADDAVHRRADLVAHVGQELALGAVGGLGRFLGPRNSISVSFC